MSSVSVRDLVGGGLEVSPFRSDVEKLGRAAREIFAAP